MIIAMYKGSDLRLYQCTLMFLHITIVRARTRDLDANTPKTRDLEAVQRNRGTAITLQDSYPLLLAFLSMGELRILIARRNNTKS